MDPIELTNEFLVYLEKEGFSALLDSDRSGVYTPIKGDVDELINQARDTPFQETDMMIISNLLEHIQPDDMKEILVHFPD